MLTLGEKTDSNESHYREELDDILSKELTAENINTYTDDAINDLANLIDEIKNDPAYKWDFGLNVSSQAQEDTMLKQVLGINIGDTLDHIDNMGESIKGLDEVIQKGRQNQEQQVYIPADRLGHLTLVAHDGSYTEALAVPKAKVALFLLQNDFDVDLNNPEEFQMSTGTITGDMMRKISYDIIDVPVLNRAILSCDEIGNKTFVFDTEELHENNMTMDDIKNMTKSQIQKLLEDNPTLGVDLIYSKKYATNLSGLIQSPGESAAGRVRKKSEDEIRKEYLKDVDTAPEGWVTIFDFAQSVGGITQTTIKKRVVELGLEARTFKTKRGKVCTHYREEDLNEALTQFANLEMAPEGWITLNSYVASHEGLVFSSKTKKIVAEANLESREFKTPRGAPQIHYQIKDLDELFADIIGTEIAPEGWITINGYAAKHGVSVSKTVAMIRKLDLTGKSFKSDRGTIWTYYNEKDLDEALLEFTNLETAPEGWVTIADYAREHDWISPGTIKSLLAQSDINSKEYKTDRGRVHVFYREQDIDDLVAQFGEIEQAPEGWTTIHGYVSFHKGVLSETKVTALLKTSDIESRVYRTANNMAGAHYREVDLDNLVAPFVNIEKAPEGWVTIRAYADTYGDINRATIRKLATKAGLEMRQFRSNGANRIHDHYRKEDLDRVVAEYKAERTGS